MAIKIEYSSKTFNKSISNIVIFSNDKFKLKDLKKYLSDFEFDYINDLLKNSDSKKLLLTFEINSKKKIILIPIKEKLKTFEIENLGAEFFKKINQGKKNEYFVLSDTVIGKHNNFLGHFLHGVKLKSYDFRKYKSKKDEKLISIKIVGNKNKPSPQVQLKFKALEEGTFFTRDLVSEPGNVLHPDEYAKRLSHLRKHGLKVNIFDKKIKKNLECILYSESEWEV